MPVALSTIDQRSSVSTKVGLFRSLFRGREDVYARRFESRRTGKSGYAPACANEWVRGICEKPRIKCAVCPNRRFLPVTDDVVRWHLQGRDDSGQAFVAGVYPLLLDERCFFLAADFDKAGWQEDARVFLEACRRGASTRPSSAPDPGVAAMSGCSLRIQFPRRWRADSGHTC